MNDLKDFIVPFSSLKNGSNHLSFDLDKEFFEAFNFSEVNDSKITAVVDFRKESHLFDIRIKWSGDFKSTCDHCLELISIQSNISFRRIVKFSHENTTKSIGEIILISYDDYQFNLAPLFFEEFVLIFPKRKIHKDKLCDNKQIKTMNKYLINGPHVGETKNTKKTDDPRWDALKQLKNKDK